MRNLIDLITNSSIVESRGIGARKPGEEFVSTSNSEDKIYLKSVTFYPDDSVAYASEEERNSELEPIVNGIPNAYVDLIGKFKKNQLAFGIAIFERPGDDTNLAFVKPFTNINRDPTQNDWNNQTGIPGFKYNSKSAKKAQSGMTPQDILGNDLSNLTPNDIIAKIALVLGEDNPLTIFARSIADGVIIPAAGVTIETSGDMHFTAFRDYFCELLHPIALQTGNFKGNAGEAAMKFLGTNKFDNTSINFGKDKTEGLSDSILISSNGKSIKVSSKGASGAEASSRNLLDEVNKLGDSTLAKKHQSTIDLIKTVVESGMHRAPLKLGVQYGFITDDDANTILGFRNMAQTTVTAALTMDISPKLKTLIKGRVTKNPNNLNLYFHATAAVAHEVADYINQNTSFSDDACEILNNGALVQVWTIATESGNTWKIKPFQATWPGNSVTSVKFSASKPYSSTEIKGNFTFKIKRNNATDVEDDISTEPDLEPTVAAPVETPSIVSKKRNEIDRPGRAKRDKIAEPTVRGVRGT